MFNVFAKLLKDESGATAIEYGLIAALVGVALIAGLSSLEGGLSTLFENIGTRMSTEGGKALGGGG